MNGPRDSLSEVEGLPGMSHRQLIRTCDHHGSALVAIRDTSQRCAAPLPLGRRQRIDSSFFTKPDPVEDPWLARALAVLPALIEQLAHDERCVVIGHFCDERSCDELALDQGWPPERAGELLQSAMHTLRRQLATQLRD